MKFFRKSLPIPLHFFRRPDFPNLGDELSPYILKNLTNRKIEKIQVGEKQNVLMSVGSILQDTRNDKQVVWGSGFIGLNSQLKCSPRITAVRGPLTIKKLGISKLAIGDPALLMPDIYRPKMSKNRDYEIGIIPHYVDKKTVESRLNNANNNSILTLDIATDDIEKFVDTLVRCKFIVSSSLHGVILAQAYGVPAVWVEFSKRVAGSGFKFADYFHSVSIVPYQPQQFVEGPINVSQLMDLEDLHVAQCHINNFDKTGLYAALDDALKFYSE